MKKIWFLIILGLYSYSITSSASDSETQEFQEFRALLYLREIKSPNTQEYEKYASDNGRTVEFYFLLGISKGLNLENYNNITDPVKDYYNTENRLDNSDYLFDSLEKYDHPMAKELIAMLSSDDCQDHETYFVKKLVALIIETNSIVRVQPKRKANFCVLL